MYLVFLTSFSALPSWSVLRSVCWVGRGWCLFLSLSFSPGWLCRSCLTPPFCVSGGQVEDNRFSISVHYRNCARIDVPRVKEVVVNVQAKHERIRMGSGKEVRDRSRTMFGGSGGQSERWGVGGWNLKIPPDQGDKGI